MSKLMEMIEKIKREADPAKVGMIACHNGLVRSTSRAGEPAEYLEIDVDPEAWQRVLDEMRAQPGIAAVEAHLFTGRRKIGDDVLLVAVAGDIRENVFPVLEGVVNKMKAQAIIKREKLLS